jgi:hypothetical protein
MVFFIINKTINFIVQCICINYSLIETSQSSLKEEIKTIHETNKKRLFFSYYFYILLSIFGNVTFNGIQR